MSSKKCRRQYVCGCCINRGAVVETCQVSLSLLAWSLQVLLLHAVGGARQGRYGHHFFERRHPVHAGVCFYLCLYDMLRKDIGYFRCRLSGNTTNEVCGQYSWG